MIQPGKQNSKMNSVEHSWNPGGKRLSNHYLRSVTGAMFCYGMQKDSPEYDDYENEEEPRTELDTHANMPVVERHALIIDDFDEEVSVSPFTPDYPAMKATIVDAAVKYECPYTDISYKLIIRNRIYVKSMSKNLIPHFIMRECGITVNDVLKIHLRLPDESYHAITFEETGFRIPLNIWGCFHIS